MKISEIKNSLTFEEAALAYVAAMPDDEVVSIRELSKRIGRKQPTNYHCCQKLIECRLRISHGKIAFVYGNPKALRALRKKLAL